MAEHPECSWADPDVLRGIAWYMNTTYCFPLRSTPYKTVFCFNPRLEQAEASNVLGQCEQVLKEFAAECEGVEETEEVQVTHTHTQARQRSHTEQQTETTGTQANTQAGTQDDVEYINTQEITTPTRAETHVASTTLLELRQTRVSRDLEVG